MGVNGDKLGHLITVCAAMGFILFGCVALSSAASRR